MIRPGLVSITFRKFSPQKIVELVREGGLEGIEWGGDVHVPHGNLACAAEARRMTEGEGLRVAAYGSYYRVAFSEKEGLAFERVLETSVALGAPLIRVWAGKSSSETDAAGRRFHAEESARIAGLAEKAGVRIAFEFHSSTLTDTNESARLLMEEASHRNARFLWQPAFRDTPARRFEALRMLLPKLENLHVFQWRAEAQGFERRPLSEGREEWLGCLHETEKAPCERFALLEFVRDESPQAFLEDAAALRQWLSELDKPRLLG